MDVDVDPLNLGIETAITCGLIVNELVSNALEHGLTKDGGEVQVSIRRENTGFQLIVRDDGKGFPEGFEPQNTDSIGMNIVRTLVEYDLEGDLNFGDDSGGLTVRITVPEGVLES